MTVVRLHSIDLKVNEVHCQPRELFGSICAEHRLNSCVSKCWQIFVSYLFIWICFNNKHVSLVASLNYCELSCSFLERGLDFWWTILSVGSLHDEGVKPCWLYFVASLFGSLVLGLLICEKLQLHPLNCNFSWYWNADEAIWKLQVVWRKHSFKACIL